MRSIIIVASILILAADAGAARLPAKISYLIYAQGQKVGRSDISVTEREKDVIFESSTTVALESENISLRATTIANATTWTPTSFTCEGTVKGSLVTAAIEFAGDKASGQVVTDEIEINDSRTAPAMPFMIFEDYLLEHQILFALAHEASGAIQAEYGLFLPASFRASTVEMEFASEMALESTTREAICRKLLVQFSGAQAYGSFFDPQRGLPVYLAFPAVNVEIFLVEFYGEEPVVRYRAAGQ